MSIGKVLVESKQAFGNGEDADLILSILRKHAPTNSTSWLEIGVGDGKQMLLCQDALRPSGKFLTVAVDPELDTQCIGLIRNIVPLAKRFQDVDISDQFDIINSRHSAYYFLDTDASYNKLNLLLNRNGVIVITIWSKDCSLYGLHEYLARHTNQRPSLILRDTLISSFLRLGLQCVEDISCSGDLTISVDSPRSLLASVLDLAARLLDTSRLSETEKVDIVKNYITSFTPLKRKINLLAFKHNKGK